MAEAGKNKSGDTPPAGRRFGRRKMSPATTDSQKADSIRPRALRRSDVFSWRLPLAIVVIFLAIDQLRRSVVMPQYYQYDLLEVGRSWRHDDPMPSFWAHSTWLLFFTSVVGAAAFWQVSLRSWMSWLGAVLLPLLAFSGFYGWYWYEYQYIGVGRTPLLIAPVARAEDYDNPWCVSWDHGRCRRGKDGKAVCSVPPEQRQYIVPSASEPGKGWPICDEWRAPVWCLQWRDAAVYWQRRSIWPASIEQFTMSSDGGVPWMCDDDSSNACRKYSIECASTVFERTGVTRGGFQE